MQKDWKTTTVGVLGAASILINQVIAVIDNDPATVLSFSAITTALGMLGIGIFARDSATR